MVDVFKAISKSVVLAGTAGRRRPLLFLVTTGVAKPPLRLTGRSVALQFIKPNHLAIEVVGLCADRDFIAVEFRGGLGFAVDRVNQKRPAVGAFEEMLFDGDAFVDAFLFAEQFALVRIFIRLNDDDVRTRVSRQIDSESFATGRAPAEVAVEAKRE